MTHLTGTALLLHSVMIMRSNTSKKSPPMNRYFVSVLSACLLTIIALFLIWFLSDRTNTRESNVINSHQPPNEQKTDDPNRTQDLAPDKSADDDQPSSLTPRHLELIQTMAKAALVQGNVLQDAANRKHDPAYIDFFKSIQVTDEAIEKLIQIIHERNLESSTLRNQFLLMRDISPNDLQSYLLLNEEVTARYSKKISSVLSEPELYERFRNWERKRKGGVNIIRD